MFDPIPPEILIHQMELGRLCWSWATLDRALNQLMQCALQIDEAQIACIATEMDAVTTRTRLVRRFLPSLEMPDWWYQILAKALTRIENEIGPLRNRCIHDAWSFDEGNFIRTDRRAFARKIKSHSPKMLLFDQKHTIPTSEVNDLNADIFIHILVLFLAKRELEIKRETNGLAQAKSVLRLVASTWEDQRAERLKSVDKI